MQDYKISDSVTAKIRTFVTDKEVFECFDKLFKAIMVEEDTKIDDILSDKELPESKTLKELSYIKGRRDMLKRVTFYLYSWDAGIKALQRKAEKEKKKKEEGGK